jgi:uncharacterized membrane protein YfcA
MLTFLFAAVSLLYATVGQAGGTAFLALMAFASLPPDEMRPTALILNIVAAAYSAWLFNRQRNIDWPKLTPFLLASLPAALLGGVIALSQSIYDVLTGMVLLTAAAILAFRRRASEEANRRIPLPGALGAGAGIGFVSGLTGVGGGVFLAPLLIALRWATPRQTAALSAPFILANSAVGLIGALYAGQTPANNIWLYAIGVLIGATIGSLIGLRFLSQVATQYVLVLILGVAGLNCCCPQPTRRSRTHNKLLAIISSTISMSIFSHRLDRCRRPRPVVE